MIGGDGDVQLAWDVADGSEWCEGGPPPADECTVAFGAGGGGGGEEGEGRVKGIPAGPPLTRSARPTLEPPSARTGPVPASATLATLVRWPRTFTGRLTGRGDASTLDV
jgi:hypothetical protein